MKKAVSCILFFSMIVGMLAAMPISADGATTVPKAPTSLVYQLDEIGGGMADGIVSVTLPAGHGADDIYLFWGDDNGKLSGYSALAPFKVSGNVVTHRMAEGSCIPQGATRLLAYTYADGLGMSESYASFTLPKDAALTDERLGKLLFEFQAVSDLHITTTVSDRLHHSDHMRAMLEDIIAISPNSIGIFNNGDTVNNGYDSDYQEFLKIWNSYPDAPIIYSAFGNHETFRYGTPPTLDTFWSIQQAYMRYFGGFIPDDATFSSGKQSGSLSFSFIKNGCKFIMLGTDVLDQNNLTLNSDTLVWLEEELQAGKGNPIFIFMHQPLPDTVSGTFSGSSKWRPTSAYTGVTADTAAALREMLVKYPEVLMFNGHTHRDMNEFATHSARDSQLPSIFGTSSVGYLSHAYDKMIGESVKGSEGYYVYVYEDKVLVRGRDFLKGEWIASAQFLVDLSEEGLGKTPADKIEAPLYGSVATLSMSGNKIGGSVRCHLPANNNADTVALFFADADSGVIGDHPFVTYGVNSKSVSLTCSVGFADVILPEDADYILIYSYSKSLGWSVDCEVIELAQYIKGGGDPVTGSFSMNKYSFVEGEQILVTAHRGSGDDWIGVRNVASSDYRTWNYWKVDAVGIGTAVDLTKDHDAFGRAFTNLTPGVYEIGWMSQSGGFLANKTPENTTTFVIHAKENISSGGTVKSDKAVYRLGEPIYVTALTGTDNDWIGMQLSGVTSGTRLWYRLRVSGVNQAFDITNQSNYTGTSGTDYKFGTLEAGEYQLSWLSSANDRFQSGKTAENLIVFTVVDMSDPLPLGVPTHKVTANIDVSRLNAKLAEAEALNQADYTPASWQMLQSVLSIAKLIQNDSSRSQTEVDVTCAAISDAIAALVKVEEKTSETTTENATALPPVTDTVTDPSETTPNGSDTPHSEVPPTSEEKDGCGSVIGWMPICILWAPVPILFKKKKSVRDAQKK